MTDNTKTTEITETVTKKPRAKKVAASEAAPVKAPRAKKLVAEAPVAEAAPAKKPRATKVKAAVSPAEKIKVSSHERHQMVATAAYFIAERRGFHAGYEHGDWLAAEAEVDVRIEVI